MAKQIKKEIDEVTENINEVEVTQEETPQPKVEVKKEPEQKKKNSGWEVRDRLYFLKGDLKPLVFTLASKHTARKPLLWFDEENEMQRELRYATNQNSPFVDEQNGTATLGRIAFRDGQLFVPKNEIALQKMLSIYHPMLNRLYYEYNPVQESVNQVDYINLELDAMLLAREIDIDIAEAVLRVEYGSKVSKLTSSELKRDLLVFAKRNPGLFIELATDENVQLRNIGVKATEAGIIKLSQDQRTFTYGNTGRKLLTVPFDEHPYSALAAWFKTDEGMEVFQAIQKRL